LLRRQDQLANPFFVREKIVVPDAKDAKALRVQISVALDVVATFAMLPTVRFDDQSSLEANEVSNVVIDR
jgi:hypothetical protein